MENSLSAAGQTNASTERAYRRRVSAWPLYDWADHAVITPTAVTFFPPNFAAAPPAVILPENPAPGPASVT